MIERDKTYSMFTPRDTRMLTTQYPELKDNPAIMGLGKAKEQKFCWYLGCRTSPLYNMYNKEETKEKAINKALDACFDKAETRRRNEVKKIPANIKAAIEAFNKYNVSVRVRSQSMIAKVMDNFEKIVDVDIKGPEFYEVDKNGDTTGRKDFDAIKKYTDTATTVVKLIPDLVRQAEEGFSTHLIEEEDSKIIEEGVSMFDFLAEGEDG